MFVKVFAILVILVAVTMSFADCRPASAFFASPEVMCRLPEKKGVCRALIMRWRYDPTTGKCYEFGFGGCDGNGNNFDSRKGCMEMCSEVR